MTEMAKTLGFQGFKPETRSVWGLSVSGFSEKLKSVVLNPLHLLGEVFEELTKRLF